MLARQAQQDRITTTVFSKSSPSSASADQPQLSGLPYTSRR
jgi:hypothetical protein